MDADRSRLFAYGTLMLPKIWTAVTGTAAVSQPARLSGYACYRVAGADFPGIIETGKPGDVVDGCVYDDIDPRVLDRLDRYEDDFYQRVEVQVKADNDPALACLTYVIPASEQGVLSEEKWDLDWFRENAQERYFSRYGFDS